MNRVRAKSAGALVAATARPVTTADEMMSGRPLGSILPWPTSACYTQHTTHQSNTGVADEREKEKRGEYVSRVKARCLSVSVHDGGSIPYVVAGGAAGVKCSSAYDRRILLRESSAEMPPPSMNSAVFTCSRARHTVRWAKAVREMGKQQWQ